MAFSGGFHHFPEKQVGIYLNIFVNYYDVLFSLFSYLEEFISMVEFRYDTQLLIEGHDLDEDEIFDYFTENFIGDSLLAVGDEDLIKIHYHTNEPWKVLEYCSTLGEIFDIVVEDMDRQERGLKG